MYKEYVINDEWKVQKEKDKSFHDSGTCRRKSIGSWKKFLKPVLQLHSPFLLTSFFRREEKRVRNRQEGSSISRQNFNANLETLHLAPTLFYHLPGFYLETRLLLILCPWEITSCRTFSDPIYFHQACMYWSSWWLCTRDSDPSHFIQLFWIQRIDSILILRKWNRSILIIKSQNFLDPCLAKP